jgi:hypothetical protein
VRDKGIDKPKTRTFDGAELNIELLCKARHVCTVLGIGLGLGLGIRVRVRG